MLKEREAYSLEGGGKNRREEARAGQFFLDIDKRKVQVVSVYTNRNNKARNRRGNGFALSAYYLMPIDKEMLRKLEVYVAVA